MLVASLPYGMVLLDMKVEMSTSYQPLYDALSPGKTFSMQGYRTRITATFEGDGVDPQAFMEYLRGAAGHYAEGATAYESKILALEYQIDQLEAENSALKAQLGIHQPQPVQEPEILTERPKQLF
jgi:hypothetical protein